MKKNNPILVFSGVLIILLLTQSACNHSPNELAFEQDQKRYVIDKESSSVSIFSPEGKLAYSIGAPSAGVGIPENTSVQPDNVRMLVQNYIRLLIFNNKGSISGLIWNDINGNRVFDIGEQGVQNVKVFIDTDGNATYTPRDKSVLTDTNGFYTITKVKPGTKSIYIDTSTLPNGFWFTTTHPVTLDIAKKQAIVDIDFGIQDQSAEIIGSVWDQTDNTPMPGVLVYLDQNNDSEHTIGEPHDTTNSSGYYQISNLPGGVYKFNIDDETIDVKYYQEPGAGTSPTDVTLIPGGSLTIDLTYFHKSTISGVIRDTDGNPLSYIRIFIDLNGNGIYDVGEPVAVTDQFGYYIFNSLPPGTYRIIVPTSDGYDLTGSPGLITITTGDDFESADFQVQELPATISGYVWNDGNGNSIRDTGENGLENVTIFLDDNNNGSQDTGELSTLTDSTGAYSFTGLAQGSYYIRADDSGLLNAYLFTTIHNPVQRNLIAGQTFTGARFGYRSKLAIEHTLLYPTRIAWGTDGNLYVSDNANGSVYIYDSTLTATGELKKLSKPLGVITDGSRNIYVGNQGRNNIEVYDQYGNLLRTIADGSITTPNDLAFDRVGNLYILDSTNDTVVVYDPTGNPTGISIGDSSRFDYAVSIAINYRDDGTGTEVGEIYVADQPNCTIHVFTLDGTFQKSIGACGSLYTSNWDGKFAGLVAVDTDQYGYIHGLDNSLNVVQVFDPLTGTFVRSYNAYPAGNELLLNLQTDIGIHPSDNRVIISNIATRSLETVATVPAP